MPSTSGSARVTGRNSAPTTMVRRRGAETSPVTQHTGIPYGQGAAGVPRQRGIGEAEWRGYRIHPRAPRGAQNPVRVLGVIWPTGIGATRGPAGIASEPGRPRRPRGIRRLASCGFLASYATPGGTSRRRQPVLLDVYNEQPRQRQDKPPHAITTTTPHR